MITPTPGRIIWFRDTSEEPLAALLCGVNDDGTVNLAIFEHDGSGPYARQNVRIAQDGETVEQGEARWMPYQLGQAKKAEAADDKVEGAT